MLKIIEADKLSLMYLLLTVSFTQQETKVLNEENEKSSKPIKVPEASTPPWEGLADTVSPTRTDQLKQRIFALCRV